MSKDRSIIIYRDLLLQSSETFIRSQAEALKFHTPYYVGSKLLSGLSLPPARTFLINKTEFLEGRLARLCSRTGRYSYQFVQQLRQLNPLLIHAHFGQDGAMALKLANNLAIPLIVTFHGYDITVKDKYVSFSTAQCLYLKRRAVLKREANLFIAVSDFIKGKLIEQNFPSERIVRHYIGIDTNLFQSDPCIQREPIVLFVGRLVEKKGCEYLIRAMLNVKIEFPEARLLIIGDGPLRVFLEDLAKKLSINCQFLGGKTPEVVRYWMQRAKVFCVPSITAKSGDAEGFGLVFTEAQAMGLPVVSTVSGGIPEAVAHEETGFLVAERDVKALSARITKLLEDREVWQRCSQRGQERVRTQFNLSKQTHELEAIYKNFVAPVNK
ncbi:glycosyltransferase [Altericista sp. CCNU0014]|uniref:glycosyltransferase n=1 Tax=Altericista sp. CCNU0014 TaxID=3082949 RepID=UPI00384FFA6A